jgi:hypothetical protein
VDSTPWPEHAIEMQSAAIVTIKILDFTMSLGFKEIKGTRKNTLLFSL